MSYLIKLKAQVFTDRQQPLGASGFKRSVRLLAHPAQFLRCDASVLPVAFSLLLQITSHYYLSLKYIVCPVGSVTSPTSPLFDRQDMALPSSLLRSSSVSAPVKSD